MTPQRQDGIFAGTLICTDIDGTLTHNEAIYPEDLEAIRDFQTRGGRFTVATGRYPEYPQRYAPGFIPNAPLVCVNGTVVYDTAAGKVLKDWPLNWESARAVIRHMAEKWPQVKRLQCCGIHRGEEFPPERARELGADYRITGKESVHKMIFIGDDPETVNALQDDLRANFGGIFRFGRSWNVGLEMTDRDSGKDTANRWLCGYLGTSRLVACGDYDNDVEMLRAADLGFAVAHATPAARAAAARVVPAGHDAALAWIIRELQQVSD